MKTPLNIIFWTIVAVLLFAVQSSTFAKNIAKTDYSGVYQVELKKTTGMRKVKNLTGFIKIKQTGSKANLDLSWDSDFTASVVENTLQFQSKRAKMKLILDPKNNTVSGTWYYDTASGILAGKRVDSSMWPLDAYYNTAIQPDSDEDGLPDDLERKYNTDPLRKDSDDDTISDYLEIRKYGTNPLKADSDDDGLPDDVWEERREYAYTIQAIVDLRPPFDISHMTDFYQDAKILEQRKDGSTRMEIILYPEAKTIINASQRRTINNRYTLPTYAKNHSPEMIRKVSKIVEGAQTDIQAIQKILKHHKSFKYLNLVDDLGYQKDLPVSFNIYVDNRGKVLEEGLAKSMTYSIEEIKERTVFADTMFNKHRTVGDCGSASVLRGSMLRAAGIPERSIMTIPLLFTYETDGTIVKLKKQYLTGNFLDLSRKSTYLKDHFFNEVFIGNQWVRVDKVINIGAYISNHYLGIKILHAHDQHNYSFYPIWNFKSYHQKRPYKYVSIIEQEPSNF